MEGMLIHDDDRSRETERLNAELSSELCATDPDDLDALIETILPRIGEAVRADSVALIADGVGDSERRTYRYAAAMDGADAETATPVVQTPALWEHLEVDAEPVLLERIPADLPQESLTPELLEHLRREPVQSAAIIPISIANERTCVLALENREHRTWTPALVTQLRLCAEMIATGLYRRRQTASLRSLQRELERSVSREHEDVPSRQSAFGRASSAQTVDRFNEIVGESRALRSALRQVQEVAATRTTVLLRGETGSGKELFARAIHVRSPRRANAFVVVNCAALPPSLIESELFGHTRGAFTGAVTTRQGRFELAHRGTLFLDEIGDLPLDLQTKLLRVLQEGTFERLGSSQPQKVDVRIVAATHRDLRRMIGEGTFREDLYYRLSVFPIRLPPLRERREDIPKLVWHIIQKHQRATHHHIRQVPDKVMEELKRRAWPGNIRELENVIEGAIIHSTDEVLTLLDDVGEVEAAPPEDASTLSAVERTHIQEVLRACGWRINGAGNAAERLGLHPNTLRFRMKKLGIVREQSSRAVHVASA
jgi:transcriptional regulator with GAF, ATPase, and Fis domain